MPFVARGQVDDAWTVTVNGQSMTVDAGGGFLIRDIAAADLFGMGGPGTPPDFLSDEFVRVMATRTVDGVTQWAFSDPFQIPDGETVVIGALTLVDAPPPLPASIRIDRDTHTGLLIGDTLQLRVTARLADGRTQDVTPRARWTTYRTSNPNVATVGPDGRITATGRGTAMITATNGGATAVLRVEVFDQTVTTVEGFVQDEEQNSVAGVPVFVVGVGVSAITDGEGRFSIPGVPSVAGQSLVVLVDAVIGGRQIITRRSDISTIPWGITDVGILTVEESCLGEWARDLSPSDSIDRSIDALAVFDDGAGPALYAGGEFTTAGGVATRKIARWDGQSWSALGAGLNRRVRAMAVFDDGNGPALYAGGDFSSAGGVAAERIARWDGVSWSPLGQGLDGDVYALAVFDDGAGPALNVGGNFRQAGGVSANRVARWNGVEWSALGDGASDLVRALSVFDDGTAPALYVGGRFNSAGGEPARKLARWDGESWSSVPGDFDRQIRAMTVFDDGTGTALYVGGEFNTTGEVSAARLARWDGRTWTALQGGVNGIVRAMNSFDDGTGPALHAAGSFTVADAIPTRSIARWNGVAWSGLGGGLDRSASALTVFDDGNGPALFVGGDFNEAESFPSARIAQWHRPAPPCE